MVWDSQFLYPCTFVYTRLCMCSCVCLPELQSGAECGGVTIVPRVVGRCLPGEPTLWRSWWAHAWSLLGSEPTLPQMLKETKCLIDIMITHTGAPRRKCLHHLHTLTLWSPYKTFQSTCKRELSNHFMIYINAEKLTSQPRRMIASKMLLPRSAEKGSFWLELWNRILKSRIK